MSVEFRLLSTLALHALEPSGLTPTDTSWLAFNYYLNMYTKSRDPGLNGAECRGCVSCLDKLAEMQLECEKLKTGIVST